MMPTSAHRETFVPDVTPAIVRLMEPSFTHEDGWAVVMVKGMSGPQSPMADPTLEELGPEVWAELRNENESSRGARLDYIVQRYVRVIGLCAYLATWADARTRELASEDKA